jgi:hypothetical protein
MFVRFHPLQTCSVLFSSLALALLCLTLVTVVWAQKDAGAIVGLVRHNVGHSLVKQFPINEQKRLKFRAEFCNVLNHVNYLLGQFGASSAEPTPLEQNPTNPQSGFGFPLAARAPRQIQFALKFYF